MTEEKSKKELIAELILQGETIDQIVQKSKYCSQTEALIQMITGKNVFLSGPAGSGKSHVINRFKEIMYLINPKIKIQTTSTTGISALNVGGITIHSYSGMGTSKLTFEEKIQSQPQNRAKNNIFSTNILIIDEISMLSEWQLQYVLDAIKYFKKSKWRNIQFIVCGDFSQLPPVSVRGDLPEMGNLCFDTKPWNEIGFTNLYLDRVYRAQDQKLKNLLETISLGEAVESDLDDITRLKNANKAKIPILVSTNKEVQRINNTKQKANPNKTVYEIDYLLEDNIQNSRFEESSKMYVKEMGMDKPIKLKKDDVVMITQNDSEFEEFRYAEYVTSNAPTLKNGMIGIITDIDVKNKKSEDIYIRFTYQDPDSKKIYHYKMYKRIKFSKNVVTIDKNTGHKKEVEVARFYHTPLKLAYAISIHKSQGQTYSHIICDLSKCWQPNLGYVALSRAKTYKGIYLLESNKTLSKNALKVNGQSVDIKQQVLHDSYLGTENKRKNYIEKNIKAIQKLA